MDNGFLLQRVGDANTRHGGREVLGISCDQDASSRQGGGQDDRVHCFESRPFATQRRRAFADLGINLIDPEPGKQDFGPTKRSEEHTSELQSLMRISYAVFCLKKKKQINNRQKISCKSCLA